MLLTTFICFNYILSWRRAKTDDLFCLNCSIRANKQQSSHTNKHKQQINDNVFAFGFFSDYLHINYSAENGGTRNRDLQRARILPEQTAQTNNLFLCFFSSIKSIKTKTNRPANEVNEEVPKLNLQTTKTVFQQNFVVEMFKPIGTLNISVQGIWISADERDRDTTNVTNKFNGHFDCVQLRQSPSNIFRLTQINQLDFVRWAHRVTVVAPLLNRCCHC